MRELETGNSGAPPLGAGALALHEKGNVEMRTKTLFFMLAAVILLAVGGGAETVGYSADTAVDTRSLSRVAAVEDKALDSRSYTADWSAAGTLNTKRIVGTMVRLR